MHRMIFAGLVLALSTSAMAGQVYKWVDAQGVTHFGAQPPQGQDSTQVSTGKAEPKEPKASFENPYPVLNKAEEPAKAPTQAKPASEDEQKAIDEKAQGILHPAAHQPGTDAEQPAPACGRQGRSSPPD